MTTERAEGNPARAPEAAAASGNVQPGPRGIGTAVAFDWGLTTEFLLYAPFLALGAGPGDALASVSGGIRLLVAIASLVLAGVIFALGEGLRRGRRLAWTVQVAINALIFLGGFAQIPAAGHSVQTRHVGGLVPALIMLLVSPTIVWLLTRRQTREWVATTTSAEARTRHGGTWPWLIAIWAIIGGAAVTFGRYY